MTKQTLAERIAACSPQTQSDIRTLADVLTTLGMGAAQKRFQHLRQVREWKLWESAAIADMVKALSREQESLL